MAKAKQNQSEPANPPAPPAPPVSVDSPATDVVVAPDPAAVAPLVDEQQPVDPAPPAADDPSIDPPVVDETPAVDPHAGLAPLLAPYDVTSCSADGVEYVVDDSGLVYVAPESVAALLGHGFEPLSD